MHNRVTWGDGEDLCAKGSGHLVHINNAAEQNFLVAMIKHHSVSGAAWIGMHDLSAEGIFEWTDGGEVPSSLLC